MRVGREAVVRARFSSGWPLFAAEGWGEGLDEAVEERGLAHRLHAAGGEVGRSNFVAGDGLAEGHKQDDAGGAQGRVGVDDLCEREAIEGGDARVDEGELVGRVFRRGAPELVEGRVGGGGRIVAQVPGGEHALEEIAAGGVVVDDEHARAGEGAGERAARRRARTGAGIPSWSRRSSLRRERWVTPNASVHRLGQALADGEAEAGAAVLARGGRVALHEGLEELRLDLGSNT